MKKPVEKKIEYSFGTGRERMIKMHIDRIRSQSLVNPVPAPGYCKETIMTDFSQASKRYSIGKKIDSFQMKLKQAAKIPGPGQYNTSKSLTGE